MALNVIQRKETRGRLLCLLYDEYGHPPIHVSSLINAFIRSPGMSNADTEVPTQLHYLADPQKGYVRITYGDGDPGLTPMRDALVQLTATGCNLVERDLDDPGVIFGDGKRA